MALGAVESWDNPQDDDMELNWRAALLRTRLALAPPGRDLVVASLAVGVAALVTTTLQGWLNDGRLDVLLVLPVLGVSITRGARAGLIAAAGAFLVYDSALAPSWTLHAGLKDWLILDVFVMIGLASAAAAGAMREARDRRALRVRTLEAAMHANRLFASARGEAAIRQRLAEIISALTGSGALILDHDSGGIHRGGLAQHWQGALEAELVDLGRRAWEQAGSATLRSGVFHARSCTLNARMFGAAVWMSAGRRPPAAREIDAAVALVIELASGAIARARQASAEHQGRRGTLRLIDGDQAAEARPVSAALAAGSRASPL